MEHPVKTLSFPLALLILAACTETPAHEQAAAEDTTPPQPTVVQATWRCTSGQEVVAVYPNADSAVITYRGTTYRMSRQLSADGARYAGEGFEWWSKAYPDREEGSMRVLAGADSGQVVETCLRKEA